MADQKDVRANIVIEGRRDHVEMMLRFLDMIDYCRAGCTRSFKIWYDGDGSARLKINYADGKPLVQRTKDYSKLLDKSPIEVDFE